MNAPMKIAIFFSAISLGSIPIAFAHKSSGYIEKISNSENMIFIRNGDAYRFPENIDVRDFEPGQHVDIHWDIQNPSRIQEHGRDVKRQLLNARGIERATQN